MTAFPLWLYRAGYTDLISVIPPGADLLPGSRMQASSLGKAPGVKRGPAWSGYSWRTHNATEADVEQWTKDGASFGLRADRFPGLDIDVMDPGLAMEIEALAKDTLGGAPVRYGRRPKRLLMYRLFVSAEPISRMRLWLEKDGASHLVELLGVGQQYLVHGEHPVTHQPYEWDTAGVFPAPVSGLVGIDRGQVEVLFARIAASFGAAGWRVYREGDGFARQNAPTDQAALRAPSVQALQDLVEKLPNDDAHYPGRDSYIKVGYAIRAAAGDAVEEGFEVFGEWASRHVKDARVSGNSVTWRADYSRMRPPYAIGWQWLLNEAQRAGHNTAREDFGVVNPTTPTAEQVYIPAQPSAGALDKLPNGDDAGHSLGELAERSELTEMPPELVPNLAWAGLKTLFSGREKTGKSTLLLSGIAAATRGNDFLGSGTSPRTVVWLTEEALRLTVRRALAMGADPDRLKIVSMGKEPTLQLTHAVGKWSPDVVVIDTLYRYANVEDENNASQWKPYLVEFDRVTQRGGALVLVIHALKAHEDGRYRGSSALGAWVDIICEMKNPQPESSVRDIVVRGRVDADSFSVKFDNNEFRLLASDHRQEASVHARERELLAWIENMELGAHKVKGAETAALAAKGLIVKDGKGWRLMTANERAQKEMA